MNVNEFKKAFALANSNDDLANFPDCMIGCALPDFIPCHVTIADVASLIRYQAGYIFGGWKMSEIVAIAKLSKKAFIIVD